MYKLALAAGISLACLLCVSRATLAADPGTEDPNNWAQYNRTTNAWRYSPLEQINKNNVGRLSVAWIAHGGDITMGIQETRWRSMGSSIPSPRAIGLPRSTERPDSKSGATSPHSIR